MGNGDVQRRRRRHRKRTDGGTERGYDSLFPTTTLPLWSSAEERTLLAPPDMDHKKAVAMCSSSSSTHTNGRFAFSGPAPPIEWALTHSPRPAPRCPYKAAFGEATVAVAVFGRFERLVSFVCRPKSI